LSQQDDPDEVLREVIRTETARIHTVLPATILDYDHSEQRATVQSRVEFSYRDPETGERQTYYPEPVPNCPVRFPTGGGFSLTFPLESGDPVKLCVAERSIDEVMEQGGDRAEPQDPRRFDLSDAIVEPGLRSFANAISSGRLDSDAVVFGTDSGQELHLGKAGPSMYVALAGLVEQELQDLWDRMNNHTHELKMAVQNTVLSPDEDPNNDEVDEYTKVDTTTQLQPRGSAESVASDKVKSE